MLRKLVISAAILLSPNLLLSQESESDNPWQTLAFLEGNWEGTGTGVAGNSKLTQNFEFILDNNFLQMKVRSVFESEDENAKGEIHEDMGIFSYDKLRQKFVMRAFYVEGFVISFVLAEVSDDGKLMTFMSETFENAPAGTKARLIFDRTANNEMKESFHVTFPGKESTCFITNILHKLNK